jgi:hydrogenase expression/formation protein HypC
MCLAVPGRVEEISTDGPVRMGRMNFGGIVKRICLDYLPELEVGDYAIVHVGFAIAKLDPDEAERTLDLFKQMGMLDEEFETEEQAFARAAITPQSNCPDGSCSSNSANSANPANSALINSGGAK